MAPSKPKHSSPSAHKKAQPDEDRLDHLNELRARWGKTPLKLSALTIDSCEVEIAREERKLGTALRMRGAAAWGLKPVEVLTSPEVKRRYERQSGIAL